MKEWGGKVIEPEYTKDVSSTKLHELLKKWYHTRYSKKKTKKTY